MQQKSINAFAKSMFVLGCAYSFLTGLALADGSSSQTANKALDAASSEALQKTVIDLKNNSNRKALIKVSPDAQRADSQVQSLAGNAANTDAIYSLSSDIFEKIAQASGGDPAKMQEIMNQAKDNPKAFYEKYFGAQEKAKLRQVSGKISSSPTMAQPQSDPLE
jgi:hypothetical protein